MRQIGKILSDPLLKENIEIVNLTGGEPTLRENMVDIVRILVSQCSRLRRIDIPTNGINTSQVIDKIERTLAVLLPTPVRLCVTVSLDGVAEVHEQVRGVPGIFQRVEKTLRELKELSCLYPFLSVSLNATITRLNIHDLENLRSFSKEVGVGINFTLAALSEIGVESMARQGEFEIEPGAKAGLIHFVQKLIDQKEMKKEDGDFMIHWLRTGKRAIPCNFRLGKVILIEPDGKVYACGNFKSLELGNALTEPLSKIRKKQGAFEKHFRNYCPTCASNCYMDEI